MEPVVEACMKVLEAGVVISGQTWDIFRVQSQYLLTDWLSEVRKMVSAVISSFNLEQLRGWSCHRL